MFYLAIIKKLYKKKCIVQFIDYLIQWKNRSQARGSGWMEGRRRERGWWVLNKRSGILVNWCINYSCQIVWWIELNWRTWINFTYNFNFSSCLKLEFAMDNHCLCVGKRKKGLWWEMNCLITHNYDPHHDRILLLRAFFIFHFYLH